MTYLCKQNRKRASFFSFFTKGQEVLYHLNEEKGVIHSMKGQAGHSSFLKLSGGNSTLHNSIQNKAIKSRIKLME